METNIILAVGAVVSVIIPPLMNWLKEKFPSWEKKALFPLIFGAVSTAAASMSLGQVHDWPSVGISVLTGLGAGGVASSIRDVAVGK